MPSGWQVQQHACPRAPSWQHRCQADPQNAAASPPSDTGDMGSHEVGKALSLRLHGQEGLGGGRQPEVARGR